MLKKTDTTYCAHPSDQVYEEKNQSWCGNCGHRVDTNKFVNDRDFINNRPVGARVTGAMMSKCTIFQKIITERTSILTSNLRMWRVWSSSGFKKHSLTSFGCRICRMLFGRRIKGIQIEESIRQNMGNCSQDGFEYSGKLLD